MDTSCIKPENEGLGLVQKAIKKLSIEVKPDTPANEIWRMAVCVMSLVADDLLAEIRKQGR